MQETGVVKVTISSQKTLFLAVIYGTFDASKLGFITFLFVYFETKASSKEMNSQGITEICMIHTLDVFKQVQ